VREREIAGWFVKWAGCWFGPRVRKKEKKNKLGWAGKRVG
jgi:hypothetical protein